MKYVHTRAELIKYLKQIPEDAPIIVEIKLLKCGYGGYHFGLEASEIPAEDRV